MDTVTPPSTPISTNDGSFSLVTTVFIFIAIFLFLFLIAYFKYLDYMSPYSRNYSNNKQPLISLNYNSPSSRNRHNR